MLLFELRSFEFFKNLNCRAPKNNSRIFKKNIGYRLIFTKKTVLSWLMWLVEVYQIQLIFVAF